VHSTPSTPGTPSIMSESGKATIRRLAHHRTILNGSLITRIGTSNDKNIGQQHPELIPLVENELLNTKWAKSHLRWMAQKDALNQDMFLIGSHSPIRRQLAFRYCEITSRECEYVALTADTSESDLKARRELRQVEGSSTLSVIWEDQAVVRAALNGRILIIEGFEKAERNVLPVLNNLLENREMQLEDGRFLVAPKRYDELIRKGTLSLNLKSNQKDLTSRLVRVHEKFRVIAVGVPSPPFPGNPLDPPLRSRFQARHVGRVPIKSLMYILKYNVAPNVPTEKINHLVALYEAIHGLGESQGASSGAEQRNIAFSSMCYPCEQSILSAGALLERVPSCSVVNVLNRIFPASKGSGLLEGEAQKLVQTVLDSTSNSSSKSEISLLIGTESSSTSSLLPSSRKVNLCFNNHEIIPCVGGPYESKYPLQKGGSTLLPQQARILSGMLQSAAIGRDVCLIGARGEGKTFVSKWFASALGYVQVESLFLFEDMTARDLFNRRSTNSAGESIWLPTPLTNALRLGRLCVLDGLHRLSAGTITALVRLLQDREVTLSDGTSFVSPKRWSSLTKILTVRELNKRKVYPVHPSFRVIGLAVPRERRSRRWLTNEVMQMFHFFIMSQKSKIDLKPFIHAAVPLCPINIIEKLVSTRRSLLEAASDKGSPLWVGSDDIAQEQYKNIRTIEDTYVIPNTNPYNDKNNGDNDDDDIDELPAGAQATILSLRQILRVARRASAAPKGTDLSSDVGATLEAALMTEFMPRPERSAVRNILQSNGFHLESRAFKITTASDMKIIEAKDVVNTNEQAYVTVGDVIVPVNKPIDSALVPYTLFFEIPQHKLVLRDMMRDVITNDHMLLMGNQGVGKNKLTDKLLMLLHREREYIQLHRDTTVGTLTLLPSLRDGVVVFEDSPLVKAMIHGRVLVIDEFDKAPTEVVVILKALFEDGEILLADGRRFVREDSPILQQRASSLSSDSSDVGQVLSIHPKFLVIALANRPGFPFLGNDFFREMGDAFACHAISNPDQQSEMALLRQYSPNLPQKLLEMLTGAFKDLRALTDAGKLTYPYSTRELVNIIKHLTAYPNDSVTSVLENIFAFDAYDPQIRTLLFGVFRKHGIPLGIDVTHLNDIQEKNGSSLASKHPLQPAQNIGTVIGKNITSSYMINSNL
jgi:MoxR-like ATPase